MIQAGSRPAVELGEITIDPVLFVSASVATMASKTSPDSNSTWSPVAPSRFRTAFGQRIDLGRAEVGIPPSSAESRLFISPLRMVSVPSGSAPAIRNARSLIHS